MTDLTDAAVTEFISECEEILTRVNDNLTLIEKNSFTAETISELYRDIHTMKGSAQLFSFNDIGNIAHALEACLDPLRKKQRRPGPELLDAIFVCVGLIEALIKNFKTKGDNTPINAKIAVGLPKLVQRACQEFGKEITLPHESLMLCEQLTKAIAVKQVQLETTVTTPSLAPTPTPSVILEQPQSTRTVENSADANADTSIRVPVQVLDHLMNLMGEMVLVRNQVLQHSKRSEDLELSKLGQKFDLVTSELQDQVMRTRMQPIGNVVGKFQRLVRDLAKELGKQIDLTIQGKETELDKTLLEAIKDPLTHIVRNCCDHGIETTQERKATSKPINGHILIRSYHEGGQVIVEISDDGKGINRSKILHKAIEKGLVPAASANSLSDRNILGLIFLPGLSTAEKVSSISGRGVGMDVVKTNIEKIGGSVDIESVEGKGTTMRLRIPLTLAIIPAMLIKSLEQVYAIPQVKLVELVRVENDENSERGKIQFLQGQPVYELRGKILPLIDLKKVLNSNQTEDSKQFSKTINIVVLSTETDIFGLIVDEVLDTADIVVKPLTKFLKSLEIFSAATILGTGQVALIIDPAGIAKAAHLWVNTKKQEGAFADHAEGANALAADAQEFLLVKTEGPGKFAIPLCLVNRLEELSRSKVEFSGERPLIQYRGAILPLLDASKVLGFQNNPSQIEEQLPTIVIQRSGKLVGLTVKSILDVTTIDSPIDDTIKDRFGILGSTIQGNEIIHLLDVMGLIEKEMTGMQESSRGPLVQGRLGQRPKVVYAEDVSFFRKQVSKLLDAHGMDVISFENGKKALDFLRSPQSQGTVLILSDIEMPEMNGLELAKSLRKISQYQHTPLVALTTRFHEKDIQEGLNAGFNCYLEKLNPEVLLKRIGELMNPIQKSKVAA